jgi:hypothetical protein
MFLLSHPLHRLLQEEPRSRSWSHLVWNNN